MATSNDSNPVADLINQITVYEDVGVDTDGRAHLFDPQREQIVICDGDVRGERISEADVLGRIDARGRTAADYARFVRDELDGWAECDAL